MTRPSEKRIFAQTDAADFIGRDEELNRLLDHAVGKSGSKGLVLLATPSAGASELLRQAFDRLFFIQENVIPFYFEIRASDQTARNTAVRFLREFLLQTVAFRRKDVRIIDASPEICEIAELAVPADGYWMDRLVESCHSDSKLNNDQSFIRNCLSAPLRATAHGAPTFVMIDDLHITSQLEGGDSLYEDFNDIYARSSVKFAFAGLRRFLFAGTRFESMAVEPFSITDAGKFVEQLAAKTGVAINDQTRDLIAVQLGANAGYVTSLFAAAAANGNDLNSFERFEQVYTDEIFGGWICLHLDAIFGQIMPDVATQTSVLRLLSENMAVSGGKLPIAYWKKHAGFTDAGFDAVMNEMNSYEIVSVSSAFVLIDAANTVLCDYIRGRIRLEIDGVSRALAVGESLSENIRRAPELMARSYRRNSAIGLRELMRSFDGRQISPALIDYGRFKSEFKGAGDDKILKALSEDNAKIRLPRMVYTANTAAFYARLNEFCDVERSAVALGFADTAEKQEMAWLAVEIDSKLEAGGELADFWCDRLEMAALNCNFKEYRLWLIATEGFTSDAIEILRERNAYGSSRKQVALMSIVLKTDVRSAVKKTANEYEIDVPMGEDTEIIATHTFEEIAKRYNFPAKAINQIKTALVEACINAAEHSLSPDGRMHQKFVVDADKITITVSNRGLRLVDQEAHENVSDKGRRGWGLKLMKGLMDEVKLEQTDDGTRITMVKYIKPA
jgi:serine/threonine-protein kinase RsbW